MGAAWPESASDATRAGQPPSAYKREQRREQREQRAKEEEERKQQELVAEMREIVGEESPEIVLRSCLKRAQWELGVALSRYFDSADREKARQDRKAAGEEAARKAAEAEAATQHFCFECFLLEQELSEAREMHRMKNSN